MAISFQQGAANGAANAGPVTTTFTSTPVANDLIVAYYVDGATSDKAMPAISGYTLINEQYANGSVGDTNSAVYWKYAAGTETNIVGPDMVGNADGVSLVVMIFRGVALGADGGPFSATPTQATGTGGSSADNPQIATAAGDVVVICGGSGGATLGAATAPSGYATNAQLGVVGVDTTDGLAYMGYRDTGLSNPENPAAWSLSGSAAGDSWTAVTLALKVAPAVVDAPLFVVPDQVIFLGG